MKNLVSFISACVFMLLTHSCEKPQSKNEVESKSWEEVLATDNSLPVARHEAAFVNVNNRFYLLGGRGIKPVSIFDTETQKWTTGEKPPLEIHHFQPVVYKDKVYIIGAMTGEYPAETPVENVLIYNTSENSWTLGDSIPSDRLRGSTGNVIKDDIVYVSCGISNGHMSGHRKWFDSYNLKTGEWQVLPDAPQARDHFQSVEAKGKIYNLAGRLSKAPEKTFSETLAKVDVYDIEKKTWSTVEAEIPTQRAGNMALRYNDEILVIGGESAEQEKAHKEVEALQISDQSWKAYPSLIEGRHGTGVFIFNDEIYIASGCGNRGGSPELTTMEKY